MAENLDETYVGKITWMKCLWMISSELAVLEN